MNTLTQKQLQRENTTYLIDTTHMTTTDQNKLNKNYISQEWALSNTIKENPYIHSSGENRKTQTHVFRITYKPNTTYKQQENTKPETVKKPENKNTKRKLPSADGQKQKTKTQQQAQIKTKKTKSKTAREIVDGFYQSPKEAEEEIDNNSTTHIRKSIRAMEKMEHPQNSIDAA